ncbi:phosphatase PAP2 family protein [Acinetobacter modestus]|uniref:phosphatase PAP2 family protein n=1 Tax=Acinetobacter modestus TaxID=1776740 RepID=UPI001F4A4050|nr:phosphatase PAP2 family protein [Acinetobacter modestus]MCH7386931.1 phosphatase PAP2 family protein [Acinetobacter modestus]
MIFQSLNIYLFDCINSFATQNSIVDRVAIFTAHELNTIFICFLLFLLIYQWKIYNYLFAKTLLIVLLSLILSDLAEIFYHHPRPFEIGLGHQLIGHGPSSSFPSQHTLTITIIAFSYWLAGFKKIGVFGIFVGMVVGLSRIYVGVHFPFDIIGSFIIGLMLVVSVNYIVKELTVRIRKITSVSAYDA